MKLFQEFSRTQLGALSKLDKFLLNPQIRTFSGTVQAILQNADAENQEPSGDRSQNDLHPEVEFSACRASTPTDSDPDETSHVVTGVNGEIPYYFPGTSSMKLKKARSTSEQQILQWEHPCVDWSWSEFFWPFNNWQVTVILPYSTKI